MTLNRRGEENNLRCSRRLVSMSPRSHNCQTKFCSRSKIRVSSRCQQTTLFALTHSLFYHCHKNKMSVYLRCWFSSSGGKWAMCSWIPSLQHWQIWDGYTPFHRSGCTPLPWDGRDVNSIFTLWTFSVDSDSHARRLNNQRLHLESISFCIKVFCAAKLSHHWAFQRITN